jgi:transposase
MMILLLIIMASRTKFLTVPERTIGKLLEVLGFSHISARPRHPKQDGEVIQAFKKTSRARSQPTSRG